MLLGDKQKHHKGSLNNGSYNYKDEIELPIVRIFLKLNTIGENGICDLTRHKEIKLETKMGLQNAWVPMRKVKVLTYTSKISKMFILELLEIGLTKKMNKAR